MALLTDAHLARLAAMRTRPRPIDPHNRGPRSLHGSELTRAMTWEEKAEQLAAGYDDEDRQNWVLWQMGVEKRRRCL